MIEINLLPQELKLKPKTGNLGVILQVKYIPHSIAAVLGVLISLHLLLALVFMVKSNQLKILDGKWQRLSPERKIVEEFNREHAIFSEDAMAIQQLIEKRPNWSEKLNRLSLDLPSGIWFSEMSVSGGAFSLQGSVLSTRDNEVGLIRTLIDNLKNDASFFRDFASLELSSVQKKTVGGYEVTDFLLSGTLNVK